MFVHSAYIYVHLFEVTNWKETVSVWSMKTCVYSYSRAPNCCNHLLIYIFFSEIPLAIMCLDNYDEVLWPLLIQQQRGVSRYFILWPLLHALWSSQPPVATRSCPCSCSGHWTLGASHTTNRARGHYCQLPAVWGRNQEIIHIS